MRILFATEYYPPFAPGGAEWTTAAWAAELGKRGHEVTVVTPNYGPEALPLAPNVTVVRVPFPIRLAPEKQREARWLAHRNPIFYLYFAWHIARAARRARADVIHAQNKGSLVPAWLAARVLRRPVVFTVRDAGLICPLAACTYFETWDRFDCSFDQYRHKCVPFFLHNYPRPSGLFRRARVWASLRLAWMDHRLCRQPALKRVDRIIGVSKGILSIYPQRIIDGGRECVVHSLPPDMNEPTSDEVAAERKKLDLGEAPVVLYAGKLSLGKGTSMLVDALPAIRRAVPGVRFVFAGKGDFKLPQVPDVHAVGSVPQRQLFALYRAADVVVVPSIWPEPLSRVLLEAMWLGRPIVATKVGGTGEVVDDGITGVLIDKPEFEKRDAGALDLAKAITELLLDPERRARMGRAGAERIARFFGEDLVGQLLAAYEAAAKRATA